MSSCGGVAVVLILPIIGLLIGLSAAVAAGEQNRRGTLPWQGPYLVGVILFSGFVVAPLGAYLALVHPAWTWLYLFEPADLGLLHLLAVTLSAPVCAAVAYTAGAGLGHKRKPTGAWIGCGLGLIGLLVIGLLLGDRMAHLTETLDWQEAPSALSGGLIVVFAFVVPTILGGWTFLLVLYRLEGFKLNRASAPANTQTVPYQPPLLMPLPSAPDGAAPQPQSGGNGNSEAPDGEAADGGRVETADLPPGADLPSGSGPKDPSPAPADAMPAAEAPKSDP